VYGLQINTDVTFSRYTGGMGLVICIWNEHGDWGVYPSNTNKLYQAFDAHKGEALGLWLAIIWIHQLDLHDIIYHL